jgi:hypothetical protein
MWQYEVISCRIEVFHVATWKQVERSELDLAVIECGLLAMPERTPKKEACET